MAKCEDVMEQLKSDDWLLWIQKNERHQKQGGGNSAASPAMKWSMAVF